MGLSIFIIRVQERLLRINFGREWLRKPPIKLGTPLSSLIGWTELLKSEAVNPAYIAEIEKDIHRLETITERFSKIGSIPLLKTTNIVTATQESFDYLESRSSKLITFKMNAPEEDILVALNPELYSWTIENLVKNGIDAMKGEGHIEVSIQATEALVLIDVSDTGKGFLKNYLVRFLKQDIRLKNAAGD